MINIVYTLERIPDEVPIVFLAGPTYRIRGERSLFRNPISWRKDAINLFKENYSGSMTLCVPEYRDNLTPEGWTYSKQVRWEDEGLEKATVILFWIPRYLSVLPGFTTNIEFGEWMKSGKIVVGAPRSAEKMRYINVKCDEYEIPYSTSLENCVANAIQDLKLKKEKEPEPFFTADTHFSSERTLSLSRRPFSDTSEMDINMVENCNAVVGRTDTLYHLGDIGNVDWLKSIWAEKIYILPGNYDTPEVIQEATKDERVHILGSGTKINIRSKEFVLIHEPENGTDPNAFYLFGHIHKLGMIKKNGLNVGVDCHHFKPIDSNTILFYREAIENHYDKNVFMPLIGGEIFPKGIPAGAGATAARIINDFIQPGNRETIIYRENIKW